MSMLCLIWEYIFSQVETALHRHSLFTKKFSVIPASSMDIHWIPPPQGVVKVNVHGAAFQEQWPNENTSGIGVVPRRANENMVSSIANLIPNLSTIANQLWTIFVEMRRAFIEARPRIIVKTDNIETFVAIKFHQSTLP